MAISTDVWNFFCWTVFSSDEERGVSHHFNRKPKRLVGLLDKSQQVSHCTRAGKDLDLIYLEVGTLKKQCSHSRFNGILRIMSCIGVPEVIPGILI